jgi:DNA-binding transcriptional LysR family regulator
VREVLNLSEERDRVVGPVRIGTTEEFGIHYLAPRLAALTVGHPGLEVELVALPRAFSLAAREVDLMVTLDRPLTGEVRYKKLTDVEFGIYGSSHYFQNRRRPADLDALSLETWCGYIKELLFTPELDMLPGSSSEIKVRYRSTSVTAQLSAAASGYALAMLPCFVAAAQTDLERLLPSEAAVERTYWIAVHEDLAKYPRVRALMNAVEAEVAKDRALFRPTAAATIEAVAPTARHFRSVERGQKEDRASPGPSTWHDAGMSKIGGACA